MGRALRLIAEGNRRPLPGAREAVAELLELLGLEALLEAGDGADAEAEDLLADRERARAERDFERADRIRDRLAELGWQVRDTPTARGSSAGVSRRRSSTASAPVAEAERGRRARAPRLARAGTPTPPSSTGLAGSPDHQGVVAEVDPTHTPTPARCSPKPDALVVVLDRIQDPQNLGAIGRSAEAAGATGLVIPGRRSASVTAGGGKASAGAVEHLPIARVPNLAEFLSRAKEEGAWVYGAEANAEAPYTQADLTGKLVLVLGSEGKGLRRLVADRCDRWSRSRCGGGSPR